MVLKSLGFLSFDLVSYIASCKGIQDTKAFRIPAHGFQYFFR